jgi:hypothetical protein
LTGLFSGNSALAAHLIITSTTPHNRPESNKLSFLRRIPFEMTGGAPTFNRRLKSSGSKSGVGQLRQFPVCEYLASTVGTFSVAVTSFEFLDHTRFGLLESAYDRRQLGILLKIIPLGFMLTK